MLPIFPIIGLFLGAIRGWSSGFRAPRLNAPTIITWVLVLSVAVLPLMDEGIGTIVMVVSGLALTYAAFLGGTYGGAAVRRASAFRMGRH